MPADAPTVRVVDLMSKDVLTVESGMPSASALDLARKHGAHHILVLVAKRVVGVTCQCDLGRALPTALAGDVAHPLVLTVAQASAPAAAYQILREQRVGCLPVVDDDRVIGLLTRADLARAGVAQALADTCASCGTHHGLVEPASPGAAAFCRSCWDQSERDSTGVYDTLGGQGG